MNSNDNLTPKRCKDCSNRNLAKYALVFIALAIATSMLVPKFFNDNKNIENQLEIKSTMEEVVYHCDADKKFNVIFINSEEENSAVINPAENEMVFLNRAPSASGAIYQSNTENKPVYELLTKGNSAFITIDGKIAFDNCQIQNTK